MFQRKLSPITSQSFFLFGARGTGKSTFVREQFLPGKSFLEFDLLDPEVEDRLIRSPSWLTRQVDEKKVEWVFIDEVQKAPRLLGLVQQLITKQKQKFILTGSSARKLKRGAGNLLAGRAFVYHLFPLSFKELGDRFDLEQVLQWGSLPELYHLGSPEEKQKYLQSYALTYLKEEVQLEQLVRKLDPFRLFLEAAAQSNGKIINYEKIGKQVGVDHKTVKSYFEILKDTWIGELIPGYTGSVRKSLRSSPKFYLFDRGVQRALSRTLEIPLKPQTSLYGEAFEHFVILEIIRLNQNLEKDYQLYYLQTKDGAEIDLILNHPKKNIAIEIKSSLEIDELEIQKLARITKDLPRSKTYYLSQDPVPAQIANVRCLHWQEGIKEIFGL